MQISGWFVPGEGEPMRLLIRWLISAVALMAISHFVPGFYVPDFVVALIAAAVIGFINATLGSVVKFLTFPLTILTLGLFLIVVNALMLKVAAFFVPAFQVRTWTAAIIGAILLSVVSAISHRLLDNKDNKRRER
jgi:putative membrane protein